MRSGDRENWKRARHNDGQGDADQAAPFDVALIPAIHPEVDARCSSGGEKADHQLQQKSEREQRIGFGYGELTDAASGIEEDEARSSTMESHSGRAIP